MTQRDALVLMHEVILGQNKVYYVQFHALNQDSSFKIDIPLTSQQHLDSDHGCWRIRKRAPLLSDHLNIQFRILVNARSLMRRDKCEVKHRSQFIEIRCDDVQNRDAIHNHYQEVLPRGEDVIRP